MKLFLTILFFLFFFVAFIFKNLVLITNLRAAIIESHLWNSKFLRKLFIFLIILPILIFVFCIVNFSINSDPEEWQNKLFLILAIGAGGIPAYYALLAGIIILIRLIRAKWFKLIAANKLMQHSNVPVLFLRSFHQNFHTRFPKGSINTIEKIPFLDGFRYKIGTTELSERSIVPIIANAVNLYGILVMYGKEEIGNAQAGRFVELHSNDDNWFNDVKVMCGECVAIIFVPSVSQSLKKELEYILESPHLTKTIFLLPPALHTFEEGNEKLLENYWNSELLWIMNSLGCKLPVYPKEGRVFILNSNKEILYSEPVLNDKFSKIEDCLPHHFAKFFPLLPTGNTSEFTSKIVRLSFKKSALGFIRRCALTFIRFIGKLLLFIGLPGLAIILFVIVFGKVFFYIYEFAGIEITVVLIIVLMWFINFVIDKIRNKD